MNETLLSQLISDWKNAKSVADDAKAKADDCREAIIEALCSSGRYTGEAGTLNIIDGDYHLVVTTPKTVEYDQNGLAAISAQIEQAGQNPDDYIKVKRTVDERVLKQLSPAIQQAFLPHRLEKIGKPQLKLKGE